MTKSGVTLIKAKSLALLVFIGLLTFSGKVSAQNRKKVQIINADVGAYDERIVANAQRLLGNVNITVDGALMWCDSLYSYTNNTVDAFSNVHIVRGDTLNMYADFIHYDPETKLAKARRNVKLIDKQMTLTTDSLDYSMINDLASYNYSGTVKDSTNVLKSIIGQYYVNEKKAYFKKNVDGVTKDYKIKSDTLIYFTDTKKVFIEGPTTIFNEKDTLYAEYGWYDSMKSYAKLTKKPKIWNAKQKVKADSIYYDKGNGEGLAMGHARIQDIENSIIVVGNRVKYNDITKIASANDSAVLIQYSKTDSLFLHADYLKTMPDTIPLKKSAPDKKIIKKPIVKKLASDSLSLASKNTEFQALSKSRKDSLISGKLVGDTLRTDSLANKPPKDARLVLAYHKVRFFRDDMQGKCDSLTYWSKDSTIQMFTSPVIWSNKNQISANYIEMINRSKDPDEIRMKNDAFIISMEDDSLRFNQIKGKNMIGYVRNNELDKIDVSGNGQSNYYARDKNGVIGLNKAESSNISIYMNKGKVKRIAFIKSPDGELKPLGQLEDGDKLLPGFNWQAELRPINKDDIFRQPAPEPIPDPETKLKMPPVPDKKQNPGKSGNALAN
ncbi:MAG: OstA-like protein [Prolixibacteraceae bacterium]|nr:OstA-like protein [Prolixibacteraceae bacterium]